MKNKMDINWTNKLTAVLLAALLIVAFSAGCTETKPEPTFSQPPVVITAPEEVQAFARDVMSEHLAITQLTSGKRSEECSTLLTGLGIIETGTAGLDFSVEVYRLEYDLTKANKMFLETTETVCYLVVLWNGLGNTEFIRLGVLTNEILDEEYSTPEMQEEYGGALVAAAMELYHKWLEENPWHGTFTFEAEILTISEDGKHLRVKDGDREKAVEIYRDTELYGSDGNSIAVEELAVGQIIHVTAENTVVYEPIETCWAVVIKILQEPVGRIFPSDVGA